MTRRNRLYVVLACLLGLVLGAVWGEEVLGVARLGVLGVVDRVPAFYPKHLPPPGNVEHRAGSPRRVGGVEGVSLPPGAVVSGVVASEQGVSDDAPLTAGSGPGLLAVVLDDFGPNPDVARAALDLPFPVTIAVLPGYAFSREIAERATERNFEVLLHQPMEPETAGPLPGPGTLYTWMSDEEIRTVLGENLASLGVAVSGLNNHMGSGFTSDEQAMTVLLRELKRRKLYFLDSVTSPDTVGSRVAGRIGLDSVSRSVFLDDSEDHASLAVRWRQAVERARKGHPTVVIGHGRRETIRFLETVDTRASRVDFCSLSDMIAGPAGIASKTGSDRLLKAGAGRPGSR